jgi:hypothetical protein
MHREGKDDAGGAPRRGGRDGVGEGTRDQRRGTGDVRL